MEWFDYLKDKWKLDIIIILLVFLSGFFQKKYLSSIKINKKDGRLDEGWKTLIVSLIISTLYIFITYKEAKRMSEDGTSFIPWGKYLISYFAATSLYDFGIRPLTNWIKRKTGDTENDI